MHIKYVNLIIFHIHVYIHIYIILLFYRHPDGATLVTYCTIQKSILRWRQRRFPSNPANLQAFGENLQGANLEFAGGHVTSQTITDANNDTHVVFYDQQMLENRFVGIDRLFIDAANSCTPDINGAQQTLRVIGVFHGRVSILIFYRIFI